jgi:TRAP-type transport system periplasmic protein
MLNLRTKRIRWLILTLMIALVLTGCSNATNGSGSSNQGEGNSKEQQKAEDVKPEMVLRFAEVNPENDPITMSAQEFARIVKEKTSGRIQIDVFASGQLGGHKEVIQSLQMGAIDAARTQPAYLADAGVKSVNIYSLPYLFRDENHAWSVLDGPIGENMLAEVAKSGSKMVGVGYYATSPRNFFFKDKKVTKLSDLKGLKLRVPEGEMYKDMVEAFGASPTPIPFSELYSALQTGIVDGAENPVKGYINQKFHEIAKYYTFDQHQADPSIIVFSEIVWNKFSAEDQQIIKDAMAESAKYYRQLSDESTQQYMEDLEAAGVTFLEVENPQEWQDAVQPLYEKYGAGYEDIIDEIKNTK